MLNKNNYFLILRIQIIEKIDIYTIEMQEINC